MRIRVLAVPDCPNVGLLDRRLARVLAGRTDVRVEHEVINDHARAVRAGMTGSPTLLVDGVDPFPVPGAAPGLACRLQPVPSEAQLRNALDKETL